jgi:hypothetical protein
MKTFTSARYVLELAGSLALTILVLSHVASAQAVPEREIGSIEGSVFIIDQTSAKAFVPGAKITLTGADFKTETESDATGKYGFTELREGKYELEVIAAGLHGSARTAVNAGQAADVPIELTLDEVKFTVTVSSDRPSLSTVTSNETEIEKTTVANAPNKEDRVDALLPLVPGVVRGPDGLINMKGARSSQGGYLVNAANATDPVTGNAAMSLPIDVVESVTVVADPYDAEYGRLTGAVASVETVTGNYNKYRASAQNLMPRPRQRDGDFVGIESATPRVTLTGPLIRNRVAFTQSGEYRFVRTPVESLPPLERDTKLEAVNSYSQVDANLTEHQTMTVSFALYPQKINYLGLNTFNPQPSTPNLHQRGWMTSLQHRYAIGPESLLLSQFSDKRFDADVTSNSTDPYKLLVETTSGGYFNLQQRRTYRTEWQETYQTAVHNFFGSHLFKVGTDFAHSNYDGTVNLLPTTIVGVSNVPLERIAFGPSSAFNITQNEVAWFGSDKWSPFQRMTVDLGLRFDHDSVTHATNAAPRAGFALALTRDARTLLKGGIGLFYDRVPLNTASFTLLPDRTIQTLSPAGEVLNSTTYVNTVSGTLRNPRSLGWNVEIDRQITSRLLMRAGVQQRNTSRDFVLNPITAGADSALLLSNGGRSFYREFQVTAQYKFRRYTLNSSYVRSKAFGDLNDFNQFFGNNAVAVIQPNERGRLAFDAPNRFLFWGQFETRYHITILPVLDVHTGFPYSDVNQAREFVGPRNTKRFPEFKSFDFQVSKQISLPLHKGLKARIGVSVFNVFNHFNPRDVQNDIDSYRYGALFNGVGRMFRGKFVWEF